MVKLSKNHIIVILSITFLILGGTFLAISQSKSGQSLVLNSTQNSPISQSSNSVSDSQSSSSFLSSQANSSNIKIQPLVADETHDVAIIEECDLALRFPKKLGEINIGIFRRTEDSQKSIRIGNEKISNGDTTKPFIMNSLISCDNEIYLQTLNAQKDRGKPEFTKDIKYEDLVKDTKNNWKLPNITDIQGFSGGSIYSIRNYFFKSQTKNYLINQTNGSDNINKLGIYIDQIQLQFNSLAPSTPSVKL